MHATDSLLTWVNNFRVQDPISDIQALKDGVCLFDIAHQIDPSHFDSALLKRDAKGNMRLMVNNVKRLVNKLNEYYEEVLEQNIPAKYEVDANVVVEDDDLDPDVNDNEIIKLISLILGAAVFGPEKNSYISEIMQLEESCQHDLMGVVQDLMSVRKARADSMDFSFEDDNNESTNEFTILKVKNQEQELKIQELTRHLEVLEDSERKLLEENAQLKLYDSPSIHQNTPDMSLKLENDNLKDEIDSIASDREIAYKKNEAYLAKIHDFEKRVMELEQETEELHSLRDQVDILRHDAERLPKLEQNLESYRRKLEEFGEMKKQMNSIQLENEELKQTNIAITEDAKRRKEQKTELIGQRQNVEQLSQGHEDMTRLVEKLQKENSDALSNLEQKEREHQRNMATITDLREKVEELELSTSNSAALSMGAASLSMSMQGNDEQHKITLQKLELELSNAKNTIRELNKTIGQTGEASVSEEHSKQVDDLKQENEKLRELSETNSSNIQILELNNNLVDKDQEIRAFINKIEQMDHTSQVEREEWERERQRLRLEIQCITSHFYDQGFQNQKKTMSDRLPHSNNQLSWLKQKRQMTLAKQTPQHVFSNYQ